MDDILHDPINPPDSPTTEEFLKSMASPLGVTGLDFQGNFVYEEFLPQLRWPRAGKIYQEMSENDATVSAVMYMIEQLVMRAGWTVKPAGDSAVDMQKAQFLEECMHDMEETWSDFILEVLSEFIYGFSFHEIVYKQRLGKTNNKKTNSKYNDGRIGWRKMPIRSQATLWGWEFDEEGEAIAFIQDVPNMGKQVTIPFERGMLFRTKHSRNNPEGRSLLRGAYRAWYFKKKMEEIEGIGIERDLAGLPLIQPAEGVDIWSDTKEARTKKNEAMRVVRSIKRDKSEGVVLPFGWTLQLLSTGGQRQFDTNAIINRWDQRIAITLLSDIVMLGADKVGSFALADVKKSLLSASLEAQLGRIADVINSKAVTQLFEFNTFPEGNGNPQIVPGEIEVPDLQDIVLVLNGLGLNASTSRTITNAVLKMASLPELTEAEYNDILQQRDQALAAQSRNLDATANTNTGTFATKGGEDNGLSKKPGEGLGSGNHASKTGKQSTKKTGI